MGLVLVTGANGFVGHALCTELVSRGISVRAAVRVRDNFEIAGCEVVSIPCISDDTDWSFALRDVSTVIHLAARVHVMRDDAENPLKEFRRVNVEGTQRLAKEAAGSGVKRLVYVSSIKVSGEETRNNRRLTEFDTPSPQDPYGISKWEAEQALLVGAAETGLEVVILRPPLVYGPQVKGNFAQMVRVLRRGIPLPLASIGNLRSLIYLGNLVDALIVCASHPAAAMQTYLVSDGEDVSTPDLLRRLGAAMRQKVRLVNCPVGLLRLGGKLINKSMQVERLTGSLCVDSEKIRRELGWYPPFSLAQGLSATAESLDE